MTFADEHYVAACSARETATPLYTPLIRHRCIEAVSLYILYKSVSKFLPREQALISIIEDFEFKKANISLQFSIFRKRSSGKFHQAESSLDIHSIKKPTRLYSAMADVKEGDSIEAQLVDDGNGIWFKTATEKYAL